jgi:hypothetical protein
MSILFFIYRLFRGTSKSLGRLIAATGIFYTLLLIVSIFTYFFVCNPPEASWSISRRIQPDVKCLDFRSLILSLGIVYAIGDVWLLLLPLRRIWQLQLPVRSRAGLIFVLSLGSGACVGAILKCVFIDGIYNTYDPTCKFSCFLPRTRPYTPLFPNLSK